MNDIRPLYTAADVARILVVRLGRVYDLTKSGALPSVRIGRQVRVSQDQLTVFIKGGGLSLPGGWRREAP